MRGTVLAKESMATADLSNPILKREFGPSRRLPNDTGRPVGAELGIFFGRGAGRGSDVGSSGSPGWR